jgi:phenylalanine ammonia-lyase
MIDVKLPLEKETRSPYLEQSLHSWIKVQKCSEETSVFLDGENLDIPSVVAVAR